jgi:AbrB family looped-hinge helix DNA binding protein
MANRKKPKDLTKPIAVRVDDRGRIVIPIGIRRDLGLEPGDTLLMEKRGHQFWFVKIDPVLYSLENAPIADDEEVTDEEWEKITKAREEIARGEGIPHDEAAGQR